MNKRTNILISVFITLSIALSSGTKTMDFKKIYNKFSAKYLLIIAVATYHIYKASKDINTTTTEESEQKIEQEIIDKSLDFLSAENHNQDICNNNYHQTLKATGRNIFCPHCKSIL